MGTIVIDLSEVTAPKHGAYIAAQNLFDIATITASVNQSTVDAIHDYNTAIRWETGGNGVFTIEAQLISPTEVDFISGAAGNWFSAGAAIDFEYWDGATWISLFSLTGLKDEKPFFYIFDSVTFSRYRFSITTASNLDIGVLSFGKSINFPRDVDVGYTPARWNTNNVVNTFRTEKNAFTQSTVLKRGSTEVFTVSNIHFDFMNNEWRDFINTYEGIPIFFSWSANEFASETVFGDWEVNSPSFDSGIFSSITMTINGVV